MCKPLRDKGYIKDTNLYRLRWVTKEGKEYTGSIYFDGDYNAYGEKDIPLTGIYINNEGNKIKIDTFNSNDVESAVKSYKKYKYHYENFKKDNPNVKVQLLIDNDTTEYEFDRMFNDWLFDYCFSDVI